MKLINWIGIGLIILTVIVTITKTAPLGIALSLGIAGCITRFWGQP